jgi:hypothetical protein
VSNGDPDMLADAVSAAGLSDVFDALLSVAPAGAFKPARPVYQLASDHFGCRAAEISFQSSNRWDIAGAKAFGFYCVWVNRNGAPNEYPELPPDRGGWRFARRSVRAGRARRAKAGLPRDGLGRTSPRAAAPPRLENAASPVPLP